MPVSVIASRLWLHVSGWVLNLLSVHARRLRLSVLGWMLGACFRNCFQAEAACAWLGVESLVSACPQAEAESACAWLDVECFCICMPAG